MKRNAIIFAALLLSASLLASAPAARADQGIVKETADLSAYCHMKFPPLSKDTLTWSQPALDDNAGAIIDFYGSCDHDPAGQEEINVQRRMQLRDYGEGE